MAVHVAELRHAADELRRGHRLRERVGRGRRRRGEAGVVDIDVRPRVIVAAAQVARGVAHDRPEQARRVVGTRAQRDRIGSAEQRVERVLDQIERVRGARAFTARDAREPACVVAREPGDPVATAASLHISIR